jgi:hypothetical protein
MKAAVRLALQRKEPPAFASGSRAGNVQRDVIAAREAGQSLARFSHTAIPGSPASPARRGAGAGFDALDDIVVKPIA